MHAYSLTSCWHSRLYLNERDHHHNQATCCTETLSQRLRNTPIRDKGASSCKLKLSSIPNHPAQDLHLPPSTVVLPPNNLGAK